MSCQSCHGPGERHVQWAKLKAEGEYEVYRQRQDADYLSDFDKEIKRLQGKKKP